MLRLVLDILHNTLSFLELLFKLYQAFETANLLHPQRAASSAKVTEQMVAKAMAGSTDTTVPDNNIPTRQMVRA